MVNVRSRRGPILLLMLAAAVTGCGGGADDEARELRKRTIVAEVNPLSELLISDAEIEKASTRTPERSLLTYWASLQVQAWDDATTYYAEDLRRFIGDDLLQYALANQAAHFRINRPRDIRIRRSDGRRIARFVLQDDQGRQFGTSLTWERRGGAWRIVHDPFLDNALAQARQLDVQMAVDPTSQTASKEAIRAAHAARKLQADFAASDQEADVESARP